MGVPGVPELSRVPVTSKPANFAVLGPSGNNNSDGADNGNEVPNLPAVSPLNQSEITRVLNKQEAMAFMAEILGKEAAELPADLKSDVFTFLSGNSDFFAGEINAIVSQSKSSTLSAATRDKVLGDKLLKEVIQVRLWEKLYGNEYFKRNELPGYDPKSTTFDQELMAFAGRAAGKLPAFLRAKLESGKWNIEVPFSADKKGEITDFKVILKAGFYARPIAEFRNGQVAPKDSPLAAAVIAYLQKLLALNPKTYKEGVFCKDTLNALYAFLSSQKLVGKFNVANVSAMFKEKVTKAKEAYDKYIAVKKQNEAKGDQVRDEDRYLQYKLAGTALSNFSLVVSDAESYAGALSGKLSAEETAFKELCAQAVKEYRQYSEEIFIDIFAAGGKKSLVQLDVTALATKQANLEKHVKAKNQKKAGEAFRDLVDSRTDFLARLKEWQTLAEGKPAFHRFLGARVKEALAQVRKLVPDYRDEDVDVRKKIELFGKTLDNVDTLPKNLTEEEKLGPLGLRNIRRKATAVAKLIDADSAKEARGILISFIKESLKKKKEVNLNQLFSAFSSALNSEKSYRFIALAEQFYHREILSSMGKEPGEIDLSWDQADAAEALGDVAKDDQKLRGQLQNLLFTLYTLVKEHNIYAESDEGKKKGVKEISFQEIVALARKVLNKLEGKETDKVLEVLAGTSDDPAVAQLELAESLESDITGLVLKDNRNLNAGNALKVTPLALGKLKEKFVEASVVPGAISYHDLKRWRPELLKSFPDAKAGDHFFVSSNGQAERVPAALIQAGSVKVIPANDLSGTELERNPLEFTKLEILAALKLAIAKHVPITDKQILVFKKMITSRITALDLRGLIKVFGEGKYWFFKPGSLGFSATEEIALGKIAKTLSLVSEAEAELLKNILKAARGDQDARFTKRDVENIQKLLERLRQKIKDEPEKFANLSLDEMAALKGSGAFYKIGAALPLMLHKNGLPLEKQLILEELATYLDGTGLGRDDLYIYDSRLASNRPADVLLAKAAEYAKLKAAKEGKAFDEQKFTRWFPLAYRAAVQVLRDLHRDLLTLASKYPPEKAGFKGWGNYYKNYLKQVKESASSAVSAPAPADQAIVGLPDDQIYEINALIYQSDAARLAELQKALDSFDEQLKKFDRILTDQAKDPAKPEADSQEGLLITAVRNCLTLFDRVLAKDSSAKDALNISEKLGEKKYKNDELFRAYKAELDRLTETLKSGKKTPLMFIYSADAILQLAARLQVKVDDSLRSDEIKKNQEKNKVLSSLKEKLALIAGVVGMVKKIRDGLMPQFAEKARLEIERAGIMEKLSSDRIDAKKYRELKAALPGLFDAQAELDDGWIPYGSKAVKFAGSVFASEGETVYDTNGRNTKLTVGQILDKYFAENKGGEIVLSNLLIEAGAPQDLNLAKIALSKAFASLTTEQQLELGKAAPAFLGASGLPIIGGLAILSRITGRGEIKFGPATPEELRYGQNASYRLYHNFMSYMARSSSERPKTDLGPQLHTLLMSREGGEKHLPNRLGEIKLGKEWVLKTVTAKDVEEFKTFLRKEIIQKVKDNPRLAAQVRYLLKAKLIAIDPLEIDFDKLKAPADGKLYDSFYADKDSLYLASTLEMALKVVGEINRSAGVEDIENNPLSYFDPTQTIRDLSMDYRGEEADQLAPLTLVNVVHYTDDPEHTSENRTAVDPLGADFPLGETFSKDEGTWLKIYGPKIAAGLVDEISTDPLGTVSEAVAGSGKFAVNFIGLMSKQIYAGYGNTIGGMGDLITAGIALNKDKAYQALERMTEGLAQTTGSFVVFEVLPWIFYSEVKNEIEAGNYATAVLKAAVITKLAMRGASAVKDVLAHSVKTGQVLVRNGKVFISNRAAQKIGAALKPYETWPELHGRTGIKLLWYTSNPLGWAHLGYKGIKGAAKTGKGIANYYHNDLEARVSRSSIEIINEGAASAPTAHNSPLKRGWLRLVDTKRALLRYRTGTRWRAFRNYLAEVPRAAAERVVGRGNERLSPTEMMAKITATQQIVTDHGAEIADRLLRAKANPNARFEITLTRGGRVKVITVSGRTYAALAEATNWKQTKAILRRHNALAGTMIDPNSGEKIADLGYDFSDGSMREMHNTLAPERIVNEQLIMQGTTPPPGENHLNEREFLENATAGRGLNEIYRINIGNISFRLNGRQLIRVLSFDPNRVGKRGYTGVGGLDARTVQLISEHFTQTMGNAELGKMLKKAEGFVPRDIAMPTAAAPVTPPAPAPAPAPTAPAPTTTTPDSILADLQAGRINAQEAAARLYNNGVSTMPDYYRTLRNSSTQFTTAVESNLLTAFRDIAVNGHRPSTPPVVSPTPAQTSTTVPATPQAQPATQTAGPTAAQRGVFARLGHNLSNFLNTQQGKAWFKNFIQTAQGKVFVKANLTSGGSFVASLVAAIGAEKLFKLLGMENEGEIFASSLAVGHVGAQFAETAFTQGFRSGAFWKTFGAKTIKPGALKGIGTGVLFGMLGDDLYSGLLDARGVKANSALRSSVAHFTVGMGTGMLGAHFLAGAGAGTGMGAAGAALPFAIVGLVNKLPAFYYNHSEMSLRKEIQEEMMLDLARQYDKGNVYAGYALAIACVPILNNLPVFFGVMNDSDMARQAQKHMPELNQAHQDALNRLQMLWGTSDGTKMAYDGGAKDRAFFESVALTHDGLENKLQNKVVFKGKEEDAFKFVMQFNSKFTPEQMARKIQAAFNIHDSMGFLNRVFVKNLQDEIAYLVENEGIARAAGAKWNIKALFNNDGTLRRGKGQEALELVLGGKGEEMKASILAERKAQRVAKLVAGESATQADRELGFVKADGTTVNGDSPEYEAFQQQLIDAIAARS